MARHFGTTLSRNGLSLKADLVVLRERMIKASIDIPIIWRPGQHVIIRFLGLGLHAFSSRKLLIASLFSQSITVNSRPFHYCVHTGRRQNGALYTCA